MIKIIRNNIFKRYYFSGKKRIVLPETSDNRIIEALSKIHKQNISYISLVTSNINELNTKIPDHLKYSKNLNLEIHELPLNSTISNIDFGHKLLSSDIADGMVSGNISTTSIVIKSALKYIGLKPNNSTLSSYFIMIPPPENSNKYPLIFSDCAVVVTPNKKQLSDIVIQTANSYKMLYNNEPKIALLSFSTNGSSNHNTAQFLREVKNKICNDFPYLKNNIDGEIQVDAALVPEVCKKKFVNSCLKGMANILIFPNLEAGNIAYKLTERLANYQAIGPIFQGLNKPSNDLSRGCSVDDIINVIKITCRQSN